MQHLQNTGTRNIKTETEENKETIPFFLFLENPYIVKS